MRLNISIIAISFVATSAFAGHEAREAAKEYIPLKDGGTLYIFQDGKMAKEDRFGRAGYIKMTDVLETSDGKKIPVTSNEVARLEWLLRKGHSNK